MSRIENDFLVLINHVDEVQLDAELLGDPKSVIALRPLAILAADGVGMTFDAETGEKVDALDVDTLLDHQPCGEHGVQPAGNQRHRFLPLSAHGR